MRKALFNNVYRFGIGAKVGIVGVVVAAVLAGCSTPSTSGGGSGGKLTVDLASYPAALDPGRQYDTASYSVYRNIFDQLLRRDPKTNKVEAGIATSWKQTNPTTWTFAIRDGVKFTDGSALSAEDAAFSITRILDPKFASQQNANFSAIASATASGSTLTITTKYPSPTLLSYLTTLSVVPEVYVKKVGDDAFNLKPVGSGPYEYVSSVQGSQVVLKKNDGYWGTKPSITDVIFRSVPEVSSRVSDLQSGRAQLATAITPDAAKQIKSSSNLQVLSAPTERVSYLAFNTIAGGPTNNVQVRKAISLAINYDSLIKNIEGGYGKPVNSVLTPLNVGYDSKLPNYKYDPSQAKSLIQQAGVAGQTIVMATSPTYDPNIVQAIQADIQATGLNVSIVNSDQATYLKKVQSPTHDWGSIRFGQWSCSCLDADGTIYPLFHSNTIWSSYSNPQFDTLVEQARQTTDDAKRKSDYSQALQILDQDLPGVGLFQISAIYGAAKNVQFAPDAQEALFVADMKLST